jgi:outer membrane receptor protein involved in Fe transport
MPSPDYREFDAAGGGTDPDRFNFRAYTPAIAGVEKAQYYVTGRYKIFDDMLQMYGDMLYSKTKFNTGFAPSPFNLDAAEANNSPFNPFLNPTPDTADTPTLTSDDQLQFLAYRLVQELGNRRAYYDTDHYRYTVGFNGEFNMTNNQLISNWGYDTGFLYERFFEIQTESGDAKRSLIVAAIAAGTFDPFIGQGAPVAGTANTYVNGTLTGTQAYDNKAAAAAASYEATSIFKERDFLYDVTVHGNLFPELWNGGIGVSAGYVHQHSGLSVVNDSVLLSNDTLGFNGSPSTKYLQEVDSFSGEIRLPLIVSTQNLPWMRSLELSFAYRYEEFEDRNQLPIPGLASKASFNNGGDPRISIRIQPIEDVILRASYGKSFRSPALGDLFSPPLEDFPIIVDPVKGTAEQPPNGVWEQGNPGLLPEETDSYSAGVVYTPKFVRDLTGGTLTMTVDLYQMYTTNVILSAAFEAQVLVSQGVVDPDGPGLGFFPVNGVFGGPGLGVTRLSSGRISAIDSKAFNAGKRLVNGMDANAVYQLPTENFGSFTWTLGYNYFFTWKAEAGAGSGTHSFLGDYNSTLPLAPGAIPYHKGFLRGEWEWRGFDFVATGNYISSFNDDSAFLRNPRAKMTPGTGADPQWSRYRKVNDYITLDMQLGYTFKKPVTEAAVASYAKDAKDAKNAMAPVGGADNGTFAQRMLWNTTLTAGVVNAFDRSPPILFAAFNDNYDTSLYNIRDRYYYISLSKKF